MKTARMTLAYLALAFLVQDANAQRFKLPFGKSKPAETQQQGQSSIQLNRQSGPWLIMCASFVGEDGRQQASRLAQELREKYRLNAYLYSHEFDFGDEIASKGLGYEVVMNNSTPILRPKQMKTASKSRFEEVAVLVGDFPSVEDAQAQKILAGIKTLKPESMASDELSENATDASEQGRMFLGGVWRELKNKDGEAGAGPLRAAFMMPNPLLPDEFFEAREIDPEIIKANRDRKFSLLKNPGKYSIKIATFGGNSTFKLDEIQKLQEEDAWLKKHRKARTQSKLIDAEKKAIVLADYLRKQGVEAYEFHDRYESYVCVGAFDWLVRADEQGVKRNHPGMVKTIETFKGSAANMANKPGALRSFSLPKDLAKAGIACDLQPIPVLVPKAEIRTGNRMFSRLR